MFLQIYEDKTLNQLRRFHSITPLYEHTIWRDLPELCENTDTPAAATSINVRDGSA
jgi:hypothetical protein